MVQLHGPDGAFQLWSLGEILIELLKTERLRSIFASSTVFIADHKISPQPLIGK